MIDGQLGRRAKSFVEKTFGVEISRRTTYPPNKHADAELVKIRSWSERGIYNQCRRQVQVPPVWPDAEAARYRPKVMAYCDALFISAVV